MVLMFFFQPLLLKISKHLLNISKYSVLNISHRISVKFDQLKSVHYSWKLLLHFIPSLTSSTFGEISLRGLRQNSSSTLCGTDRRRKRERSSDQGSKTFLFRHSSVEMADLEKGMAKNKLERQETDTSAEVEYNANEKSAYINKNHAEIE